MSRRSEALAVIDIGSHSVRMLIEANGKMEKQGVITRLGEGAGAGLLTDEAMERTLCVIEHFANTARDKEAKIFAFATSAVRDVSNQERFILSARERAGINVRVLSGVEEADLAFAGASLDMSHCALGVIDVGGGSTEVVVGSSGTVKERASYDIGAVRLTGLAVSAGEMVRISQDAVVPPSGCLPPVWRGIGGTVTTLAAMNQALVPYDPEKVHNYPLPLDTVKEWVDRLDKMTVEERMSLPGIQPERGKVILAGTCVLLGMMFGIGIEMVHACTLDNLYGGLLLARS